MEGPAWDSLPARNGDGVAGASRQSITAKWIANFRAMHLNDPALGGALRNQQHDGKAVFGQIQTREQVRIDLIGKLIRWGYDEARF